MLDSVIHFSLSYLSGFSLLSLNKSVPGSFRPRPCGILWPIVKVEVANVMSD